MYLIGSINIYKLIYLPLYIITIVIIIVSIIIINISIIIIVIIAIYYYLHYSPTTILEEQIDRVLLL